MADPPPPPPPHGQSPRPPPPGGLPDGNYDIFIIPPHSAGGGFLYLPSMQPQRNSFLLGVACTLLAVGVWTLAMPVLSQWAALLFQSGGLGVLLLIVSVGVGGWAWGKTQVEGSANPGSGPSSGPNAGSSWQRSTSGNGSDPPPHSWGAPPPRSAPQSESRSPPPPKSTFGTSSSWEKAKEETRKREEERKRAEELKKKVDEIRKAKEESERAAKAKAEKEKWEQARAREKDQREREARERIARERADREASKSDYKKPSARSAAGTETAYSFRPYDTPPKKSTHTYKSSAASSISGLSEGSYAPSQSTARTTPPPSMRGPYSTDNPDKIQIKAVYLFSDSFPNKPQSQLIARQGTVTDGLILRIQTEGLFIDDDIRGVPQREWDVKAWTLKLVEDGMAKNSAGQSLHVLRATARDMENKKYTFILDEKEGFKVAIGLAKLRKGSQVRSLGINGMKEPEVRSLLTNLGWM